MTEMIFREIDEEVRKERLEQLWKRHGRKAVTLATVLILSAAGYSVWQNRQEAKLESATASLAELLQAVTPDNGAEMQTKLDAFAQTSPVGQEQLARLYAAGLTKDAAQHEAAVKQLEALASASGVAPLYRDLAKLLSVQLRMGAADAAQLKQELTPLAADKQPWRNSARELLALLSLQTGDVEAAKATLGQIKADQDAPKGVKDRATKLLSTL